MKIVCITPIKHLDEVYERLEQYGEVIYVPEISKLELTILLSETPDIEYLFTNPNKQNFILDEEVLKNSNIKVINTCSTGLNHIDMDCCERNNVKVWSLKEDFELINDLPSTAELSFGLMMSLLRKIPEGFDSVKKGEWDYEPFIGRQIKGLTIGIIGFGRLGRITTELFKGWGVNILVNDPYVGTFEYEQVEIKEIQKKSDVVFLHLHANKETRNMVDRELLSNMKKGSILINTSRGELVNEKDVINSIKEGHLGGYGTDVITDEFGDVKESELVEFSRENNNVVITPHVGGMTWEGQTKAYKWAIDKFGGISER
jgi:D-3-phosphoglycerate dehydrogenase|tara:strand:+ start:329 stop:1276 length:948 start_codon:yes stop_codon:yes gene_type:complete